MPDSPNKLSQFWQELKRRRVIHVIIVYATAAYVIIELVNNVYEPLRLPEWTPTLVIIILLVGFPLAIIFSWIFDVTPEGIEKTKPAHQLSKEDKAVGSRGWKIASYISFVVIVGLIVLNIIPRSNRSEEIASPGKSIAVLPFENMSGDPEQEYFSAGITEDILNHLSKIADLSVKSRTSTLQYRDRTKSIPEIGDELGVDVILEGSVRKAGNKVRIVAQLIDVKSDIHMWSETFDREIIDIFSIQSEIAIEIANTLQAKLTETEKRNISKEASMDITAYDYYLKARQIWYDCSFPYDNNVLENIIQLYEQAIDLDPGFALGYYGIGITLHEGMRRLVVPVEIWIDSALALSEKAIMLDPSLPEGYILRSSIYRNQRGREKESQNDLQRAYELAPNV